MSRFSIVLLCILFATLTTGYTQNTSKRQWKTKYQQVITNLKKGNLTTKQYLDVVDSLTERLTVSGLRYSAAELMLLLEPYKIIIEKDGNKYQQNKANYYRFLMNNALANGRSGEALFYVEKNEAEIKKLGKTTLLIPYTKLLVWAKSGNNDKVIELYGTQRDFLSSLIESKPTDSNIIAYMQAMQFYFYVMRPMLEKNNPWAEEVNERAGKTEAIIQKSYKNIKNKNVDPAIPALLALFCNIEYHAHLGNKPLEKQLLDSAASKFYAANVKLGPFWKPYQNILHSMILNYYLDVKDNENASLYLDSLIRGVQIFDDERANLFKYQANLDFNKGNVIEAYQLLDSALHYKTSELSTAYIEMTNLLYAHTESEYSKAELKQRTIIQKRQNLLIAVISLIALTILLVAALVIKRQRRKMRAQIRTLSRMTDIAVRDAGHFAAKEEQKRLGQDLHDEYSGSLVSILHNIEFFKENVTDSKATKDLDHLKNRVNEIYESIRSKSHKIFKQSTDENNSTFKSSVSEILDAALPDKLYIKQIDMDPSVVAILSLQQRIELLRILQEATANILKHSKASEVSIFLFAKNNLVIFQISDNGIGLKKTKINGGLGLESINNRSKSLGGRMEVFNEEGTTLAISFPISIMPLQQ